MQEKQEFIAISKEIIDNAINVLGKPNFENELERQLLGAFIFGIINGGAYEIETTPAEVQGLMIATLINTLKYSPQQATAFCQHLIDCTNVEENSTVNAIIHRGVEGYYQLKEQNKEAFKRNYNEIIELVAEDM